MTKDPAGNPSLQVYPSVKYNGNFGQLSLNDSNVGTSILETWVETGVTSNDIAALNANKLLPLSAHDQNQWDWQGSSGFTSSLVQDVNRNIDRTYWLPLFKAFDSAPDTYQGGVASGSNHSYNIVAFVPVKIVQPNRRNHDVVVQPATLTDPNALFNMNTATPAGTSTDPTLTLMPPKLSS